MGSPGAGLVSVIVAVAAAWCKALDVFLTSPMPDGDSSWLAELGSEDVVR